MDQAFFTFFPQPGVNDRSGQIEISPSSRRPPTPTTAIVPVNISMSTILDDDFVARKTLYLTGGMSQETKLRRLHKAVTDPRFRSIHIVGQDFSQADLSKEDDLSVSKVLSELLTFDGRKWKSIKLSSCLGRVDKVIDAIMASNVKRFILSPSQQQGADSILSSLSQGLQTNISLLTLGYHNARVSAPEINLLCEGLIRNVSLLELTLHKTILLGDHAATALAHGLESCTRIQHLSFQNCQLSDAQVFEITDSLKTHPCLEELCLVGNKCTSQGLVGISNLLASPESKLSALDLASQNVGNQSMDLSKLALALRDNKRLSCLQLSENHLDEDAMQNLALALQGNTTLQILHLAWCQFSNDSLQILAKALCSNRTLAKLVLYECSISDRGLSSFAANLSQMHGLQQLDLGGKQEFTNQGMTQLLEGLRDGNVELETISLNLGRNPADSQLTDQITLLTDLNRGGRRFLRAVTHNHAPEALWPLILERAQKMKLPSTLEPLWSDESSSEECDLFDILSINEDQKETIRRHDVIYHLVRNGLMTPR
jgi:Ran GTPase-activating protein (RanGAP) involved in mRNA processing and transport